jgi:hypothetical protein
VLLSLRQSLTRRIVDADESMEEVLNKIESEASSEGSDDSGKNMQHIVKKQMSLEIRKSMFKLKEKTRTDSFVVLDIQKSLQFQLDQGLKRKMQQTAIKSMFVKQKT